LSSLLVLVAVTAAGARAAGEPDSDVTDPGLTNGPIAYQAGTRVTITTLGTTEGDPKALASTDPRFPLASAADPDWSPSGLRLAFTRKLDGRRQIFLTGGAGGETEPLFGANTPSGLAEAYEPTWSDTGAYLAFTGVREGLAPQIFRVSVRGLLLQQLTDEPGGASQPDWSPGGAWIAFTSARAGTNDIWAVSPRGAGARRISRGTGSETDAAWRPPKGREIAYAATTPTRTRILVRDDNGVSAPRTLTRPGRGWRDGAASWAPSGGALLFTRGNAKASSTRLVNVDDDAFHKSTPEIAGGIRANWGPLPVAPDGDRAPTDGTLAITPVGDDEVTLSPPDSTVQDEIEQEGARVPEGFLVRAPGGERVDVVGDAPGAEPVDVEVSGTFEVLAAEPGTSATLGLRGEPPDCSGPGAAAASLGARAAKTKPKKKLKLKGKGAVKAVKGHAGGATSKTEWSIEETCAGIVFTVDEGQVEVTDDRRPGEVQTAIPGKPVTVPG
jgi:Tol biopolymer transport system component